MTQFLLFVLMISGVTIVKGQLASVPTDVPMKCEILQIQECNQLGYNSTYIPNLRGHVSQEEAYNEFRDFLPSVRDRCSNAILHFLCSFYFPVCFKVTSSTPIMRLDPCQSLCEYVEPDCTKLLNQNGFVWPTFFNCSLEQSFTDSMPCFGQTNLSAVTIPKNIFLLSSTEAVSIAATKGKSISLVSTLWLICVFAAFPVYYVVF